jgi:uncharacterized protein YbaP (TraB family)
MRSPDYFKILCALTLFALVSVLPADLPAQTEMAEETATAPAPKTAATTEEAVHTSVWKIQGEKSAVYLLGSVHVLKEESYPLPEAMEAAYKDCQVVAFEADLDEMKDQGKVQDLVLSRGLYPEGVTLSQALPEETYNKLLAATTKAGLPMAQIERLKPWILSIQLTATELNAAGYKQEYGVDHHFFEQAKADEKERVHFETIEYQINLLAGMSDQLQGEMLSQSLDELDQIPVMADVLRKAWREGDAEKLDEILEEQFKDYPKIKSKLLTQRNRRWVPEIEKLLAREENCLVVVGTLHMVGKKGVVQMLRDKGHEITQM